MERMKRRDERDVEKNDVQTLRLQRPFLVVVTGSSGSAGYQLSKIAHIVTE
jgi:hypothetical protein